MSGVSVHVKICGVTTASDAVACVDLGASAIGLNFVAASPRRVTPEIAREISRAIGKRALVVGVVADESVLAMRQLVIDAELGCLQLHGRESPEVLASLLPHAYKAVRVATIEDVREAEAYPGEHLLVDAKGAGALGGTGHTFDWSLVVALAKTRKLTLAGGLDPDNVADAVGALHPYCVDVASGVEAGTPGVKNLARVRAFIERAKGS